MGQESKIEWLHWGDILPDLFINGATFNGWTGCTKVSAGCANCYAEKNTVARVFRAREVETWGKNAARTFASESKWKDPIKWNNQAAKLKKIMPVFAHSLSDIFEEYTGRVGNFTGTKESRKWQTFFQDLKKPRALLIHRVFQTPNLFWLLLSKRPENFHKHLQECIELEEIPFTSKEEWDITKSKIQDWLNGNPPINVMILTSIEDQKNLTRLTNLEKIPALYRGLSCEPLLGEIKIESESLQNIQWLIAGGESGPSARKCRLEWIVSLQEQCLNSKTPFFFKQWGNWGPDSVFRNKKENGNNLQGKKYLELPKLTGKIP
jgi:protein gp37